MGIAEADAAYTTARATDITIVRVSCPALELLEGWLRLLSAEARNAAAEDDASYERFVMPLWRYLRLAHQTGLPLSSSVLLRTEIGELQAFGTTLAREYPSLQRCVPSLITTLGIASRISRGLLDVANDLLDPQHEYAVVTAKGFEGGEASVASALLTRAKALQFTNQQGLARDTVYHSELIVGRPNDFRTGARALLLAPRSARITIVCFDWESRWRRLLESRRGAFSADLPLEISFSEQTRDLEPEAVSITGAVASPDSVADLATTVPAVVANVSPARDTTTDHLVAATLLRLASGWAYVVPSESTVRIMMVGTSGRADGDEQLAIHGTDDRIETMRSPPLDVIPGWYLFTRDDEGDADIDEIAARLHQSRRRELEAACEEWKSRLRNSISGGKTELLEFMHAKYPEVTRAKLDAWAGSEIIMPQRRDVFAALVGWLNLGTREDALWRAGIALRQMNVNAGKEATISLLSYVAQPEISAELKARGDCRIGAHDLPGIVVRVSRVEEVIPLPKPLRRSRIPKMLMPAQVEAFLELQWRE